ncbi:ISKra4 family transposase [Chroococcidiopsis sp. CCMEE 29]|uniref:ISKra4 family transposase n=1 Tax=Chroococcidiopsis sp. CCMEE 29 TaxID=155894 RepID=UPI00201FBFCF|nr:ISKra4 family transposase [Chroococcidiopsis sp. CCMEE 29]
MEADKKAQIQAHARAIAALLYEETDPEQVKTLAGIETAVRRHLLEHVTPEMGFFIATSSGTTSGRQRSLESILGRLRVSEKQAQILEVKAYSRWSPYLERCCLLVSANESYERTAEDIEILTGVKVSHSTQQRLVHRQTLEQLQIEQAVDEISIDGGKVRLRTPQGQPSEWRDYKGVNLHEGCVGAFFQDNERLVNWVNAQPFSDPLTCLGDGHDGIWNLYAQIGISAQRREILDWYHLVENLGKVGGSQQRLDAAQACLWQGDVDGAIAQFNDWQHERVTTFIAYLNKHRHRIVNYGYYQAEGISIGSGAIESTVKQIGRRIKISGAQWSKHNVPQVLKQRCAYLNGQFSK